MIIGSSLPGIVARDVPGFKFQSDPNKPSDPAGQDKYNRAAIQVAFLAGVFYTLVGVLRLGFFTNFLSHSVISGFMTGAATLIGLTQMKFFFGYDAIKNKNWNKQSPKSVSFFFFFLFFPFFFFFFPFFFFCFSAFFLSPFFLLRRVVDRSISSNSLSISFLNQKQNPNPNPKKQKPPPPPPLRSRNTSRSRAARPTTA